MGINFRYSGEIGLQRKQMLMYWHHNFATHLQRSMQQQVERSADRAFGGIFHRHDPVTGRSRLHFAEYIIYRIACQSRYHTAKALQCRFFRKGPLRAKVGDRHGFFQGPAQ